MLPCLAEAVFDLALAELQLCPPSLASSWPPLAFLHRLQLPVPEERELQGAFLLPRC